MSEQQHDDTPQTDPHANAATGEGASKPRDRIKGIFSTQAIQKVGTGTTTRRTIQKMYWFVEEDAAHGTYTAANPTSGISGGAGFANGSGVQVYQAFLQFKVPGSDVEVTAGLQDFSLPTSAFFCDSVVWGGTRAAALIVNAPLMEETLSVVTGFSRMVTANILASPLYDHIAGRLAREAAGDRSPGEAKGLSLWRTMCILYEVGIWVSWFVDRSRKEEKARRQAAAGEADAPPKPEESKAEQPTSEGD